MGVLIIRALRFGVDFRAPDFWELPFLDGVMFHSLLHNFVMFHFHIEGFDLGLSVCVCFNFSCKIWDCSFGLLSFHLAFPKQLLCTSALLSAFAFVFVCLRGALPAPATLCLSRQPSSCPW